jgi:hypothetical protein
MDMTEFILSAGAGPAAWRKRRMAAPQANEGAAVISVQDSNLPG